MDRAETGAEGTSDETAPVACPGCGGALRIVDDATYVCRIGHSYELRELALLQDQQVREALLASLRALRDQAATSRRLAARFETESLAARRAGRRALESDRHADALERLVGEVEASAERRTVAGGTP